MKYLSFSHVKHTHMRAHSHTQTCSHISGGLLLEWTGLCEITAKRSLTGSAGPLLNCSEDYITLEWDKRLHTRRMGGGHQTRLCPDCARSNPVGGRTDFPEARCHFYLNNSYEESTGGSAFVPSFVSSCRFLPSSFFFPVLSQPGPFFYLVSLITGCTELQYYGWASSKSFNPTWCLRSQLGCSLTMNGTPVASGEILVMVF